MLVWVSLTGGGCAGTGEGHKGARAVTLEKGRAAIALDGETEDWPADVAALADADWLYFRVIVPDLTTPLQASKESVALWVDLDGDARTGVRMQAPSAAQNMGVDLIVRFSPPLDTGAAPGRGVAVWAGDEHGSLVPVGHAAVRLLALPSHASSEYELRLSRHPEEPVPAFTAGALRRGGEGQAMLVLFDPEARVAGWSDPERFRMPPARERRPLADALVPARSPGVVRVVSYNVKHSAPMANPGLFGRLMHALNPDVLAVQEWNADATTLTAFFAATVSGEQRWQAAAFAEGGVAIISPHPITRILPDPITVEGDENGRPVRFVAAIVHTPAGDVAVANLHLKCCGTAGSPEDIRRIGEAHAVHSALSSAWGQSSTLTRVLAGDFNLVGTRMPLDILASRLDADGSDLTAARTLVLGDAAIYTWFDPASEFAAGRLDYVLISDASARITQALVLNTAQLSEQALARLGLDREDTASSDHLPIVVDLQPNR